jgi:hypothetical protein
LKQGKPPNELKIYRPRILLPIVSKDFEKLLFKRAFSIVADNGWISNHQFDFKKRHFTIKQTNRNLKKKLNSMV